ncbi:MAG TPA: protein-disulfide reductase DsbD N-terminal domain-containing protein [Pyrinomonadaceae bacterium]|jgi:DsbC/DsbD-like thiol-disulfide interchange protein
MNRNLKPGMNRNLLTALFLLLSSFVVACSSAGTEKSGNAPQAPTNTNSQAASASSLPEDVLQVSATKVEVQAGKSAEAEVKLKIKEGYHINANPASQYQIPTQLTIEQAEGIKAGQPKYPASITKKFSFAPQPLAVYETEATINVPVSVAAGAAKGERSVPARLRFQACDEQVCYPPKNLQLSMPVTVK